MTDGNVLDLDSKACIGVLATYLTVVEDNEISLKLQNQLLTRWWHVNVCAVQVMESYKTWIKLFDHLDKSQQGDRLIWISQNGVSLGKIKNLKCDGALFCSFSHSYWARHMNWLYCIDKVSKTFGHSSPLMLVRLIIMLDDLQEVKKMQSSDFDNYKEIREVLTTATTKMASMVRTQQK